MAKEKKSVPVDAEKPNTPLVNALVGVGSLVGKTRSVLSRGLSFSSSAGKGSGNKSSDGYDDVSSRPLSTLEARDISAWFGTHKVLDRVSLEMPAGQITSLIGPSGCGKSTVLRILNRMHELVPSASLAGEVLLDGVDVYDPQLRLTEARRNIGMVFQKPNPFPKSIYENIAYGPRIHGMTGSRSELDGIVEQSLQRAGLWDEVKDRLNESGTALSGGQQQRLCIARAIAVDPEVILMDEPCSALDPIATARIEELIDELRGRYAIVIVTHSMQQAASLGDRLIAMHRGRVYLDVAGAEKQRLTESDLLGLFTQMRRDDRFDDAACAAVRAHYR